MRFRIIWTGKTRDPRLRALIDDYSERLSHFSALRSDGIEGVGERRQGGHR